MLATQLEAATGSSKNDTTNGSESDEPSVRDVTLEILGERRQEWRDGFESGVKQGTTRVLQSDALAQIALELKVTRTFNDAMAEVAHQRERLLAHWKSEAQWWREEHDRVHAEYCAFVKDCARRFLR